MHKLQRCTGTFRFFNVSASTTVPGLMTTVSIFVSIEHPHKVILPKELLESNACRPAWCPRNPSGSIASAVPGNRVVVPNVVLFQMRNSQRFSSSSLGSVVRCHPRLRGFMAVDCMSLDTETIHVLATSVARSLQKLILRTSDTSANPQMGNALGQFGYSPIRRLQELLVLVSFREGCFAPRLLLEIGLLAKCRGR
jgi:hypothetical protein